MNWGPVINLRYPPRQTQPFHQLDRSVWIVTTSRETAGQASQAFTPSRAPSTLQCVRTCLYHWNAPSWFPSQVIFHIVTSLGPQQLSKTWHYHIRASFKARLSKKGVPLSPISFEKKQIHSRMQNITIHKHPIQKKGLESFENPGRQLANFHRSKRKPHPLAVDLWL